MADDDFILSLTPTDSLADNFGTAIEQQSEQPPPPPSTPELPVNDQPKSNQIGQNGMTAAEFERKVVVNLRGLYSRFEQPSPDDVGKAVPGASNMYEVTVLDDSTVMNFRVAPLYVGQSYYVEQSLQYHRNLLHIPEYQGSGRQRRIDELFKLMTNTKVDKGMFLHMIQDDATTSTDSTTSTEASRDARDYAIFCRNFGTAMSGTYMAFMFYLCWTRPRSQADLPRWINVTRIRLWMNEIYAR